MQSCGQFVHRLFDWNVNETRFVGRAVAVQDKLSVLLFDSKRTSGAGLWFECLKTRLGGQFEGLP
jgi:hypothetical protein